MYSLKAAMAGLRRLSASMHSWTVRSRSRYEYSCTLFRCPAGVLEKLPSALGQPRSDTEGREVNCCHAGAGGRYELLEPLQTLRKAVLLAVGQECQVVEVLLQTAVAARKSQHLPQGMAALHQLQLLLAAESGCAPRTASTLNANS